MENYCYNFTLNRDEYIELLKFQLNGLSSINTKKIWFTVCIPAIAIGALFAFKLYTNWVYMAFIIAIIALWLFMVPTIWDSIIERKVNKNILNSIDVKGFAPTTITVDGAGFTIKANGKTIKVKFSDINFHVLLQNIIIIAYNKKDMFIIPNRIFETKEKVHEFINSLETSMAKERA